MSKPVLDQEVRHKRKITSLIQKKHQQGTQYNHITTRVNLYNGQGTGYGRGMDVKRREHNKTQRRQKYGLALQGGGEHKEDN